MYCLNQGLNMFVFRDLENYAIQSSQAAHAQQTIKVSRFTSVYVIYYQRGLGCWWPFKRKKTLRNLILSCPVNFASHLQGLNPLIKNSLTTLQWLEDVAGQIQDKGLPDKCECMGTTRKVNVLLTASGNTFILKASRVFYSLYCLNSGKLLWGTLLFMWSL